MKKLLIAIICVVLSAAWCHAAETRVSVVFSADIPPYRQAFDGFREALQEKKGAFKTIEHSLDKEGADATALRIAREKPLLVLAIGPEAMKFAKENIKNTPVVVSMVLRPQSFAGPNITWVSLEIPARIKLEKVKRALPDARRVGVIHSPGSAPLYREIVQGCKALGLQAVGKEVGSGKELPDAFKDMVPQVDLFLMVPDTKVYFPKSIEYLLVEGLRNKVPVVGLASSYTRAGALISFEPDYTDAGRQAGEVGARIIDGESPADIEPLRPRRIKTSLNLAVAERLEIEVDPLLVKEANDVFK